MVSRQDTFGGYLITTWNGDEYISVFLFRFHLVYSFGISGNHFHSIRDDNTLERLVVAIYPSVNRASFGRLDTVGNNDTGIAHLPDGISPPYGYGVFVRGDSIEQGN